MSRTNLPAEEGRISKRKKVTEHVRDRGGQWSVRGGYGGHLGPYTGVYWTTTQRKEENVYHIVYPREVYLIYKF